MRQEFDQFCMRFRNLQKQNILVFQKFDIFCFCGIIFHISFWSFIMIKEKKISDRSI
jgi:hypothetical protein